MTPVLVPVEVVGEINGTLPLPSGVVSPFTSSA